MALDSCWAALHSRTLFPFRAWPVSKQPAQHAALEQKPKGAGCKRVTQGYWGRTGRLAGTASQEDRYIRLTNQDNDIELEPIPSSCRHAPAHMLPGDTSASDTETTPHTSHFLPLLLAVLS